MTGEAPVAVIGGGWAGFAAAVSLAERGLRAVVFEAASVPGGRARRVLRAGLPLDNGQHLLLGAYSESFRLIARAHGDSSGALLERLPLAIVPLDAQRGDAFAIRLGARAGTLDRLAAIARARGLSWTDKLATLAWFARLERRGFRCPPEMTAAQLFADAPRASAEGLFAPLCVAALNTPVASASAQVFADVMKASLAGGPGQSEFVRARTDLSALFPEAAARFVAAHGGSIRLGESVRVVAADESGVTISPASARTDGRAEESRFAAAILAVGPHQLSGALAPALDAQHPALADTRAAVAALEYEPIATVYLGFDRVAPLPCLVSRLDDRPGQWVFDRHDVLERAGADPDRPALAQLLAVVISASGPHDSLDHPALVRECDDQLRRLAPSRPPCIWSQVVIERRATFRCSPGRSRPTTAQPLARLGLAGDYLDPVLPATLESAVRSGVAAAELVARAIRGGA